MSGGPNMPALNLAWQAKAWRFYGAPDGTIAAGLRANQGAIGEVRFVMGWVAQQIGRVGWKIKIDGKELDQEQAAEMMKKVANRESTIVIATNLIVAGELNYVALGGDQIESLNGNPHWDAIAGPSLPGEDDAKWLPISVIDPNRLEILKEANLNLRAIWPHPAKMTVPDPPLRSVLDVLEEIEQVQDLAYSQNRSRIAQMGILTVANEFDMATPGGDFGQRLEESINAPIVDPRRTSASPILLRGPFELMTGALSNGARAVQWTKPVQEFDERLDDKMKFLIQRLAWGFPVAPEILLGMTATNRAVAFQIEESTYRSHVEPIANLVGRVYAMALKMLVENEDAEIEVEPDATELLARRHSVADAKDAYDRGLVRGEWVRKVLGIAEEDAATEEDLERIIYLRKGVAPGEGRELDPSEVAGNEPVRASASAGASLDDITRAFRGAADMAHATAVSRVGAAARTRLQRQHVDPPLEIDIDGISNRRLPSILGPDRLAELGLNLSDTIRPATDQLIDWLSDQVDGDLDLIRSQFNEWSLRAIHAWPLPSYPATDLDAVLRPDEDEAAIVIPTGGE
jgi:hypothetical protein